MKKRISAKDVAIESGVSAATVSYVLNAPENISISRETRERVLVAVEKLGYVPNQAAKTLGTGRALGNIQSSLLGIVIPQSEPGKEFMFSNPFYSDFLSAVEFAARRNGYQLLITGVNINQRYIEIAKRWSLDGIIILGVLPWDEFDDFKKTGIPTVLVDSYYYSDYFHTVGIDDQKGSFLATDYLIKKGHKRIAFISGPIDQTGVCQMRYLGYRKALEQSGIPYDDSLVMTGDVSYDYGVVAARELSSKVKDITAAFATADIIATGAINGFQAVGLRVPEDFSVVGFDDIYLSRTTMPPLTTIRQGIKQKGEESVKIILEAVKNPAMPKREVTIPLEVIERGSVKAI